jgi:signal transduction histidine kinase
MEEVKGRHLSIICPPERAKDLTEALSTLFERGEAIPHREGTVWRRIRSASRYWFVLALGDASGSFTGAFSVAADMTDRKLMEHQLMQAQKLESIGHLAAGIAHEINIPMRYIGDNVGFLEESVSGLAPVLQGWIDCWRRCSMARRPAN